jgi:biotin carboxyl carrier protein
MGSGGKSMSRETFRVSGKKVSLTAPSENWTITARPGGWLIGERKNAAGKTERRRFALLELKGKLSISADGRLYHGALESQARDTASGGGSDLDLIAQFPGKVRKILVKEGESVAEGSPLLLIEAMKMEFSVKAPFTGKIENIRVTEGQQLTPGDRFLDLTRTEPK